MMLPLFRHYCCFHTRDATYAAGVYSVLRAITLVDMMSALMLRHATPPFTK